MSKQFLRVNNVWTEILTPSDTKQYLANLSGESVEIQFSNIRNLNIGAVVTPTFTVGGSIGQICTPKNVYVYAKAKVSNDVVLLNDIDRIKLNDQEELSNTLDALGVQVMRATERITNLELEKVQHNSNYYWLLRYFLSNTNNIHQFESWLTEKTIKLDKRLYAIERYVIQHKKEYNDMKTVMDALDASGIAGDSLDSLKTSIANVTSEMTSVIGRLNTLEPQVNDYVVDVNASLDKAITPIQSELTNVHYDLNALNNTMVVLANQHTKEEINAAAEQLIKNYEGSTEIVERVITSVRDLIIELINKVDYDDVVVMSSDINTLKE